MASVKTSVDNLNQQKKEYDKAIKSLNNALEQIKKVNGSLGNDAMLEGVRTALTKLSASLETRAGTLLLMTKALEQSGEKYTAAQKTAVSKSNQFRAHNRDFYGNPVVVTAATAATAAVPASGAGSTISITSSNTTNVTIQTNSEISSVTYTESSSGTDVSQASAYAGNTAASEATVTFASESIEEPVSAGSVGGDPAEVGTATGAVDTGASNPRANVFATEAAAEAGAVTAAVDTVTSNHNQRATVFATGAAAASGAVIGGIAGAAIGSLLNSGLKKTGSTLEENQELTTNIETQLEEARERLRLLNEEQDAPTSTNGT